MNKRLYQKRHGLPGVPFVSGYNGTDGNSGNNIYIGYIYDYFENTEVSLDNLVRVAQRDSSYYTGVFEKSSVNSSFGAPMEDISPNDIIVSDTSYKTLNITSTLRDILFADSSRANDGSVYDEYYTSSYSKDSSGVISNNSYVKVDMQARNGGLNDAMTYDVSTRDHLFFDNDNTLDSSYPYDKPFVKKESANIQPGKNILYNSQGFKLFNVVNDNESYTFAYRNDGTDLLYDNNIYKSFDDAIKDSKPTIEEIISQYQSAGFFPIDGSVNYIKYNKDVVSTTMVPDHLSSDIKSGDVIYFYTDADKFQIDHKIEYMVEITPGLEECNYEQLLAAAVITEPFTFKYAAEETIGGSDYVYTTTGVTSGFCKEANDTSAIDSSYISKYGKNFTRLVSNLSNSALNLGILSNEKTDYVIDSSFKEGNIDVSIDTSIWHFNRSLIHLQTGNETTSKKVFEIASHYIETDVKTVDSSGNETITRTVSSKAVMDALMDASGYANDSKIPIKTSALYIKNDNMGNVESVDTLFSDNIIIGYDGFLPDITSSNYDASTQTITVSDERFVSNPDFDDYKCGFDVVCYDKTSGTDDTFSCCNTGQTIKKLVFRPIDVKSVSLPLKYGDNTAYDIVFWLRESGQITRYSRHTRVVWNRDESQYSVNVWEGTETQRETEEDARDKTIYEISSISADKNENGQFDIYVPKDSIDFKFYINSQEVSLTRPEYNNNWFEIRMGDNHISPTETDKYENYVKYTVQFSVDENYPTVLSNSSGSKTAEEYIKNVGDLNSPVSGCDLFNKIIAGTVVASSARTVTASVTYKTQDGRERSSYYKITQPGYTDKRTIPQVTLKMHKDLDDIELSNKSENGVLSNQFQFFIDVDIDKFSREQWGSFVSEDDITLNMDIENCPVDYEFVKKYTVQNADNMSTLHVHSMEDNQRSADFVNNYFSIKTSLVGTDVDDFKSVTQARLDESAGSIPTNDNMISGQFYATVTDSITLSDNTSEDAANSDEHRIMFVNSNTFGTEETETRATGLNDRISINLRNIHFSDIKNSKKLRIRVVVEFGNPLFSKLFFRFYVKNMWINYAGKSIYVGTQNLAVSNWIGSIEVLDYMFATETMNAFICPVSFTAVPEQQYMSSNDWYEQIKMSIDKYVPLIDTDLTREEKSKKYVHQSLGWFDFSLKKKFFQDNVRRLSVRPLKVTDLRDKVSTDNSIFGIRQIDALSSTRNVDNYLSVWYYAHSIQQQGYFEDYNKDKVTFRWPYYAEYPEELLVSRYSQYETEEHGAPVFTRQEFAYDIRDNRLYNSVQAWNREFQNYGIRQDGLFSGHLSSYGNGYIFLDPALDDGRYDAGDTLYSLKNTVDENQADVLDKLTVKDFNEPDTFRMTQPLAGRWYQRLLYKTAWMYPKYSINDTTHQESVDAYDLVPCGKYLVDAKTEGTLYEVPYNLFYEIYPRCAYDYENDNLVVFMLRAPSVLRENNYDHDHNRIDTFSRQLPHSQLTVAR